MKVCNLCHKSKLEGDFYPGIPRCKECHRQKVKERYQLLMKDPEWREKELERQRMKTERHRIEGRYDSEKARSNAARAKDEWRIRNNQKSRAHGKVAYAIRKGTMARLPCEICGEVQSESHHDDYSKPLDVRWLCDFHHKEHHREMKRLERFTRDQLAK